VSRDGDSDTIRSGVTVTVADFVTPFAVALIVTVRGAGASVVTIENVALLPVKATDEGTGAAASLDVIVAFVPGVGAVNVSIPVTVAPATTSMELSTNVVRIGGVTVNVCDCVAPPDVAVIVTVRGAVTVFVTIGNDPLVPDIARLAGTVAALVSLLESATVKPAMLAPGLSSVTDPVALTPAATVNGAIVTAVGRGVATVPGVPSATPNVPMVASPPDVDTTSAPAIASSGTRKRS